MALSLIPHPSSTTALRRRPEHTLRRPHATEPASNPAAPSSQSAATITALTIPSWEQLADIDLRRVGFFALVAERWTGRRRGGPCGVYWYCSAVAVRLQCSHVYGARV